MSEKVKKRKKRSFTKGFRQEACRLVVEEDQQLEYKLSWSGGKLILVDAKNTSRRCQTCGHVFKDNRKSQSSFCCVSCGHRDHADINAAKKIWAAGHAVSACGDISSVAS